VSTTKKFWLWAAVLPVIVFVGETMCLWPWPRFLGPATIGLLFLAPFSSLLLPCAAVAAFAYPIIGLVRRNRKGETARAISKSVACVSFVALWILAVGTSRSIRHRSFVAASSEGDRIVRALSQYRAKNGGYPERLDELIPGYIDAIPYTGMIGYPSFRYIEGHNDLESKPGEYELRIDCTSGGINFDRFIYWPSEKYPDRIQGNGVERIRCWAYVHE
jgi:hypothetical protein